MMFANMPTLLGDSSPEVKSMVSVPLDNIGVIESVPGHDDRCRLWTRCGRTYLVPVPREGLINGLAELHARARSQAAAAQRLHLPGIS